MGVVKWWTKNGIQVMVLFSLLFQLVLFAIPIARRHSWLGKWKHLARLLSKLLWLNGIQVMVLFSLLFQLVLFAIPIARRHSWPGKWRHLARLLSKLLWLSYQLADKTALYVLGHMAISSSPSSEHRQLMALWAALLLVHLGGQDTITALAPEDNRLWKRHLLTLVVQTAGVLYVTPVHRGSNKQLSAAAGLMAFLGFVKFVERIYVLWFSADMRNVFGLVGRLAPPAAEGIYTSPPGPMQQEEALKLAHRMLKFSMGQFIDDKAELATYQRSVIMAHHHDNDTLYKLVELQLSLIHDMLYTKSPSIHTWLGCLIRAFSWVATVVTGTLLVFHFVSSTNYGGGGFDAGVTFTLLAGAFILETASLLKAAGSTWTVQILDNRRWNGLRRMILLFRRLVKAADCSRRWPGFIGTYREVAGRLPWSRDGLSWEEIKPKTKAYVLDGIRRMVADCQGNEEMLRTSRGGLSLQRLPVPNRQEQELVQNNIIHNEFDESIFIWTSVSRRFVEPFESLDEANPLCPLRDAIIQISEYMGYLFRKKPDMLPPPVRHGMQVPLEFTDTNRRIHKALNRGDFTDLSKLEAVLGVWVEMLCYAASYCNRMSHTTELKNGTGEFATIVWLVRAALFHASRTNRPQQAVAAEIQATPHHRPQHQRRHTG
ncbi:hypothetical protein PVAP13_6NG106500 [Panicum virgatum]|uniref:DUF4220 domain-containing protein n=1 Tax=Panicum virgatum TaxID=38727 RepID=A0A8T0QVC9_PANVG|nr:hypothetical protein PVAP13_6NG106500 [Panicum virgatum]